MATAIKNIEEIMPVEVPKVDKCFSSRSKYIVFKITQKGIKAIPAIISPEKNRVEEIGFGIRPKSI